MSLLKNINNKKVLVTGGAGFIGSNIVKRLLDEGAFVIVLDDFYTGDKDNLSINHSKLTIIEGSVTDYNLVESIVKKVSIVIHLAARNIIVSTRNPREDYEVNIGGTLNVLLAAQKFNLQRVTYASSASIYGNPRYLPINEDDASNLLSPYSVSKLGGENYCKAFYETYGLSTSIVRYSNIYGVWQSPNNPYCGVVTKFFEAALDNKPIKIHGDGEQTRDYTYIDDAVEATLLATFLPKADGQIYNVGTGRETSVNQLASMISQIVGNEPKLENIDRRDIDNIRRRVVNIEKIRRELRFTPLFTIENGLKKTFEWLTSYKKK